MKNLIKTLALIGVLGLNYQIAYAVSGGDFGFNLTFATTSYDNSVNEVQCNLPYGGNPNLFRCHPDSINSTHSGSVVSGTRSVGRDRFSAYYVNFTTNNFSTCEVQPIVGVMSGYCRAITPTGAGALNGPTDVQINGNFAYFIDNDGLTQCRYNFLAGIESASCVKQPMTHWSSHLTFANSNTVYFNSTKCNVTTNGIDLTSCTPNYVPLSAGEEITGSAVYNGYIFFSAMPNNIIRCTLNADGNFDSSSCVDTNLSNTVGYNFAPVSIVYYHDLTSGYDELFLGNGAIASFGVCLIENNVVNNVCLLFLAKDPYGNLLPYHALGVAPFSINIDIPD
jgi:hypothetical protein